MTQRPDGSKLPADVQRRIDELVKRSGLEGSDREDVRDELVAHFEDGLASGRSPEELIRAFGDVASSAQWIGEERGVLHRSAGARASTFLSALARDVRIGVRRLRANPAFVLTAVLSLAIGIGANTAIFTLVNAIIVRDEPYRDPEQLYNLYMNADGDAWFTLAYPDLRDVKDAVAPLVESVPATQFSIVQAQLSQQTQLEILPVEMVNGDYFGGLGIRAAVGRLLGPEDDVAPGAHPVVVLGHGYWKRAYAEDPGVVGRTIELAGRPYTIVGVTSREFAGSVRGLVPELFVPILMQRELTLTDEDIFTVRSNHAIFAKLRLKHGTSLEAVSTVLANLASDLRARGELTADTDFRLVPTKDVLLYPPMDRFVRAAAWMLSGVVALVLLIACANLASFLLAKSVDRRREMAIQLSLGASRGVLVRQLLVEALIVSIIAGAAGIIASTAAMRWLVTADMPLPLPITLDLSADRTVLGYGLAVSALAGLLFGLAPAMHATRTRIADIMREETAGGGRRGRARVRSFLVAAQVAVTMVLLLVAGLLLRSFQATQSIDPGFGDRPTAILTLGLRSDRWNEDEGLAFADRMLERFRQVPGVTGAALTGRLHLDPLNTWNNGILIDGVEPPPGRDNLLIDWTPVTPDFFAVMGIDVLSGRAFTDRDRKESQRVAIINDAMARQYWPGEDPMGRVFRYPSGTEVTIVGVVETAKVRSVGEAPRPQFYRPLAQSYTSGFTLVATTTRDAEATALELARVARQLDPDVFTWEPKSMARHLATQRLARQLAAWIVSVFAVLALVLASVGLYGLVNYAVSQRRREVGIRMSLGAGRGAILRLMLNDGLRLVAIGLAIGFAVSAVIARTLSTLLYGIPAIDPVTFLVVPLVLGSVGFLAAFLPARRATRTDPGVALRAE